LFLLVIPEVFDILISVMRENNDSEFHPFMKINEKRKAEMRKWKSLPEAERPTWEQFKRGLESTVVIVAPPKKNQNNRPSWD